MGYSTVMAHMKLSTTVLEAPDARELAEFYRQLMGWEMCEQEEKWVTLTPPGGGTGLSFQTDTEYTSPTWPAKPGQQQMQAHLDIAVEDLEAASAHALTTGATLADYQPQERARIFLDPVGHPFCLYVPYESLSCDIPVPEDG